MIDILVAEPIRELTVEYINCPIPVNVKLVLYNILIYNSFLFFSV